MNRKHILFCVLLFTLYVKAQDEKPPNVIMILTDDMGYGEVAAHGNTQIKTPHLDQLVAKGVSFTDFHVNAVCSPSRAALLTGRYASHTGVWHTLGPHHILNLNEKILPQYFKDSGYHTFMVGKWHLGDTYPYTPEARGFDQVFRIGGGGLGQLSDYWGNGLYDGHYFDGASWVKTNGFSTDVQFSQAKKFIDQTGKKPFFLYLATTAPHTPVGAPDTYVAPYLQMGLKKSVAQFYGMVSNIDTNVGGLIQYLKQKGLLDNTLLIFMSDNGSANDKKGNAYNAGMKGKKGSLFDGGHRVPCIAYWPRGGWFGGKKIEQLTAHIDWLPTLAAIGCFKPKQMQNTHGKSLVSLLRTNSAEDFDTRILLTENKVNKRGKGIENAVIMQNKWRWVAGKSVYNLQEDPGQQRSLAKPLSLKKDFKSFFDNWFNEMLAANKNEKSIHIMNDQTICLDGMSLVMPLGGKPLWNQKAVVKGQKVTGYWDLFIETSGRYKLSLSRTPLYSNQKINQLLSKKGKKWKVESATIEYNGSQIAQSIVQKEATCVVFDLYLEKGPCQLGAFFWEQQKKFSVNFLEISKS